MGYQPLQPLWPFTIQALASVHYFEYDSNYAFAGEQHDFWEFLYVDKGEVTITADGDEHTLKRGEIIFHAPGEFHTVAANGIVAPNLVVASFVCEDEAMQFFNKKVLHAGDEERALLARIVQEGTDAFSTPMDDPLTERLDRAADAPFGAEQLIAQAIAQLLICFYRRGAEDVPAKPTSMLRERTQQDFIERITAYLEENLSRRLTLSDICRENLVGRSYLQKVFREKTGGGAMEYFGTLKIDAAKRMVREGNRNFTEIAAQLGYNSIHYFSRHFKKVTGMTPSEYAQSVKLLSTRTRRD